MNLKRIGLDTSKAVFTVHGVGQDERTALRCNLKRGGLEDFFAKLPPTVVALEACGGSHHWGRRLTALGHEVRLIPPQYVKPFVKRGKNDRNDAEAISEAAARPEMTVVAVKSAEQQAGAMILSVRELLVGQRTQLVNAIRGQAAEFGVVAAKGVSNIGRLLEKIAGDTEIPQAARDMLALLGARVTELDSQINQVELQMMQQHKANPVSRMLDAVPSIGPIVALTCALTVDASQYKSARHFAASLGVTPKERSTAGRQRLGSISKQGNERLRRLLVTGAMAVIKYARPGSKTASPWLLKLLERKPRKVAAVALANKTARIIWAIMSSGEAYRRQPAG
jgi:transposase